MADIASIKLAFDLVRQAIDIARKGKDLLPGAHKKAAEVSLDNAEKALKIAESKIAQELGYELCKCTFPPQIMLSTGYVDCVEKFKCSKCGKISPPNIPEKFRQAQSDYDPLSY